MLITWKHRATSFMCICLGLMPILEVAAYYLTPAHSQLPMAGPMFVAAAFFMIIGFIGLTGVAFILARTGCSRETMDQNMEADLPAFGATALAGLLAFMVGILAVTTFTKTPTFREALTLWNELAFVTFFSIGFMVVLFFAEAMFKASQEAAVGRIHASFFATRAFLLATPAATMFMLSKSQLKVAAAVAALQVVVAVAASLKFERQQKPAPSKT